MSSPFDSLPPPWIHVVDADVSALTDWACTLGARGNASVVRFIRGRKMQSDRALFAEVCAALQFPYYFGENWNALDECLTDLSWLHGSTYLVIVTDADRVLTDAPSDFGTFIGTLSRSGESWSKSERALRPWAPEARPFHVLLDLPSAGVATFEAKLRHTGVAFARHTLDLQSFR